jgi:hypothetical protein
MWDKDKLFNKDKPTYKDPTTTNIKPVVIHPNEPEPSLYIPSTKPRQQQPHIRNKIFWIPPDHSACTSQWCAYAIGDKAASWSELTAMINQKREQLLTEERKRKDPNNYEPYKPQGF